MGIEPFLLFLFHSFTIKLKIYLCECFLNKRSNFKIPAKKTSTKKATTKKYTRFEKARILGSRAIQLSMGAKPLVEITEDIDPIDIALAELNAGLLPLDVKNQE